MEACIRVQRRYLTLQHGVLYRFWEDIPGGGTGGHLQLVLPANLVNGVLEGLHNTLVGGHMGERKTLEKVRAHFYWPGQRKEVEQWCRNCNVCLSRKSPSHKARAPMEISQTLRPMQRVAMDILGPLPETLRGNKYILVVGEYFTKWKEAFPLKDTEALTIAKVFVNEFVCRFGVPDSLHTDQGRNFEAKVLKEVCQLLGVKKTRTTPYHPQSDGLVERFNRTLLDMLSMAVKDDERDWDLLLSTLLFAYRTSRHVTTGVTPFELMYGRDARLPEAVLFSIPASTLMCSRIDCSWLIKESISTWRCSKDIRSRTMLTSEGTHTVLMILFFYTIQQSAGVFQRSCTDLGRGLSKWLRSSDLPSTVAAHTLRRFAYPTLGKYVHS